MIKGPIRLTRQTKTLTDLAISNKPECITRIYNLITVLLDHNLILTVRKLTRKLLQYFGQHNGSGSVIKLSIYKLKTQQSKRELNREDNKNG